MGSRSRLAIQEETNTAARLALLDVERILTSLLPLQAEEMRSEGPVRHVMPPLWAVTAELQRVRLMLLGYCAEGNDLLMAAADLDRENKADDDRRCRSYVGGTPSAPPRRCIHDVGHAGECVPGGGK